MLILIVAEGPDKGRIYEWSDEQTVIVGRESKDLRLSDGKASRQHARFKCEGGKWYVRDLASRHGTLVNNIRTQGKTPLGDGDRVRIGHTELVVARMPVEQLERASLLGDQPGKLETWHGMPGRNKWYIPRPTTAAAMAAAAFAIGCSAWMMLNTSDANQTLRTDLLASQNRATQAQIDAADAQQKAAASQLAMSDRTDQILSEVRTLGSDVSPVIHETLASVKDQQKNTDLLNDINQALAQMHTSSMTTLDTILASVESQSEQWHTLAQLQEALAQQNAGAARILPELQAVAATAKANESALDAIQSRIEQVQAQPNLDANILDQLETVAAELKDRPTLDQVTQGVRTALAKQQTQTDKLLTRIENRLPDSPDTQALIQPLRDALAAQNQATEQMIAKAFENQTLSIPDDQLDQLKALIASQPDQTASALRDVINGLDTSVDLAPVLDAIENIKAGNTDDKTVALLNDLTTKLQSAPSSDELASAVTQAVNDQFSTTRPLLEQIAGSLDAASEQAQTSTELIDQLRLALHAQEAADTRLDQIYDMLAEAGPADDNAALSKVLREIRSKSITGMDEMRSTIRRELQAGLTDQRLAMGRTPDDLPKADPIDTDAAPAEPEPDKVADAGTSGTFAMASQDKPQPTTTVSVKRDGLSDVEQAYRLAFKTGKPITLGAGGIDPETGEVRKGRTIDPADAKAAGINDWRDWYLMDDFAERMRLQQQAIDFHNQQRNHPPVLGIPQNAHPQDPHPFENLITDKTE